MRNAILALASRRACLAFKPLSRPKLSPKFYSTSEMGTNFNWGYGAHNGPHVWPMYFKKAAGMHQSPINLQSARSVYDATLNERPLTTNYQPITKSHICNTGQSCQVTADDDNPESVLMGGPIAPDAMYKFLQFHFHWGSDDRWGSEHLVDGTSYAAELHLVHWNQTHFSCPSDAIVDPDSRGLCVLGVFLQLGQPHKALQDILAKKDRIPKQGATCSVDEEINLTSLLPQNTKDYWTYKGSLTTPPCEESVLWIVFNEPITVSREQLEMLRSLTGNECSDCMDSRIQDNNRPTVPLGSRKLRTSFPVNQ